VIVLAAVAFALAATPAPARLPQPTMAVTPARLSLAGASSATVHLASAADVVVDAEATGLAIDLRGRPRIASAGDAAAWLEVIPRHLTVRRLGGAGISVTAKPPPRARPGDHVALLLLTTRPSSSSGVAVRVRIGIVVTVRVPGKLVRRLVVGPVRVRRRGRERIIRVGLANRGNVTERLARGLIVVTLSRRGHLLARLKSAPRDLLPRSRGRTDLVYRGPARGWVRALIDVGPHGKGAHPARRFIRLRL
jgi:hypothetical protein